MDGDEPVKGELPSGLKTKCRWFVLNIDSDYGNSMIEHMPSKNLNKPLVGGGHVNLAFTNN